MARISTTRRGKALPAATLGKKRTQRYTYDRTLLEAVPLAKRGKKDSAKGGNEPMWVSLCCLRFTSLCPVTGQPDWADITLNYVPNALIVESKSLKEYLGSFRMHGDFHEDVVRIMRDDLVAILAPRYLEVVGVFDSRGSIAIWPYAQYADPKDAAMVAVRDQRFAAYVPGRYAAEGISRRV
jgi:7-cyano-7-deazaguanine reductase